MAVSAMSSDQKNMTGTAILLMEKIHITLDVAEQSIAAEGDIVYDGTGDEHYDAASD